MGNVANDQRCLHLAFGHPSAIWCQNPVSGTGQPTGRAGPRSRSP
ncbi:hypothetical protein NMD1_01888 [Novosphingobium sp. MD-1]|nr:hypothetical protein NMD1_01888 [Novosphingobium sp. MD-1]